MEELKKQSEKLSKKNQSKKLKSQTKPNPKTKEEDPKEAKTNTKVTPKAKVVPNPKGKGGFKKGVSGNPKGRPKGARDKVTTDVKEAFALLLDKNLPKFQTWIDAVADTSPARALDIMINLTNYVIPRMSSADVTVKDEREEIDYSKLTKKQLEDLWKK